jgi:DNA polymerase-3 subunit delta'
MSWQAAGHEWAERLLRGHLARGDVRHAYLLTGPSGVGRRTLALRFAQALNCLQPPEPGDFCGRCRICRQTAAMQHSDLSVVQAEKEGGTLKVEQVRDLQRSLSLMPYEARYRVALLLRFEEANPNAQNALLKTLEEAPQRVILLLTAGSAETLLPTIVSRCEVLRLRPMALDKLQGHLEEQGLERSDARLLAHLSGGRLGYAQRLKDDPGRMEQRRSALEDLLQLLGEPRRARFTYAEQAYQDKETLRETYGIWLSFWRDLMLRSAGKGLDLPLVNVDLEQEIGRLAGGIDLAAARACTAALEHGIARLDANTNPRLLTEVILLGWPRVETQAA